MVKIYAAFHRANDRYYSGNDCYSGINSPDRFSTIAVVACIYKKQHFFKIYNKFCGERVKKDCFSIKIERSN